MKRLWAAMLLIGLTASPARAEEPIPEPARGIEIDARLGEKAPLDRPLVDPEGRAVTLRQYLQPGRPLLLTLNYYGCPTLCSFLLQGLLKGLRGLTFTLGKEFQVVTVSIDPREGPELAKAKRATYLQALGKEVAPGAWPFLTGREADVRALADGLGFRYRWDQPSRQYIHAAGIYVLTPEGVVSQVLYGIEFPPRDLRLALVEAARGAIGNPVDRLLLLCYHYDPAARRYGPTAVGIMRAAGGATVVILGLFLLTMWRRERRAMVG